jgi:hypothetical protein
MGVRAGHERDLHPYRLRSSQPRRLPVTAVAAPPPEAMEGFRHLRALAAYWNGTWRYRPAGADLEAALRQAGNELEALLGRARADVESALRLVEAARRNGPDVLTARVYGDTIPELRLAALIEGAALWGETADLAVEGVADVDTSMPGSRRGRFNARVRVRCLSYAEIEQRAPEAAP